jgi:uncharacterized membrane protein
MARAKTKDKRKRRSAGGFFLRGLITILPVVLTVVVFALIVNFVRSYVTKPINNAIYWALESNGAGWKTLRLMGIEPYALDYLDTEALTVGLKTTGNREGYDSNAFALQLQRFREDEEGFFRDFARLAINDEKLRVSVSGVVPPWVGLVCSLALVLWLGWLATGFMGRRAVALFDRLLNAIPGVRSVYPYSKQFTEFVFGESKLEFDTVVAAPYPSEGIWSIGFVTNRALRGIQERVPHDMVTVFIPSSPMPMTGYTVFLRADRLIPLPISVDEALRVTVSGGVLVPPSQAIERGSEDLLGRIRAPSPASEGGGDTADDGATRAREERA